MVEITIKPLKWSWCVIISVTKSNSNQHNTFGAMQKLLCPNPHCPCLKNQQGQIQGLAIWFLFLVMEIQWHNFSTSFSISFFLLRRIRACGVLPKSTPSFLKKKRTKTSSCTNTGNWNIQNYKSVPDYWFYWAWSSWSIGQQPFLAINTARFLCRLSKPRMGLLMGQRIHSGALEVSLVLSCLQLSPNDNQKGKATTAGFDVMPCWAHTWILILLGTYPCNCSCKSVTSGSLWNFFAALLDVRGPRQLSGTVLMKCSPKQLNWPCHPFYTYGNPNSNLIRNKKKSP